MKKKFTFLIAALMLLTMINLPGKAVGQTTLTTSDLNWPTPQLSENFNSLTTCDNTAVIKTNNDSETAYGIFNKMYNNNTKNHYGIFSNTVFGANALKLSAGSGSPVIASITKSGNQSITYGTTGAFSIKIAKTDKSFFGFYNVDDNNAYAGANATVYLQYTPGDNGGSLYLNSGSNWGDPVKSSITTNTIEVCVIYNNTNNATTYGNNITLGAHKAHVFVNGSCVMNNEGNAPQAFSLPTGKSLAAFRVLPQTADGNVCTVDDVVIYNSLPTAASSNPTVTASPAILSGFSYVYGEGPSNQEKYITVSGSNLGSNNLVVTPGANYQVRKADGEFTSDPISYTPDNGSVANSNVYVRLKAGLSAGPYNSGDANKLVVSSGTATPVDVALSGTVIPKYTLTISATNGHIEDGDGNTLTTGSVAQGAEIEITAVPNTGYKFASWSFSGTGSSVANTTTNPTTFTMGSTAASLTANFEQTITHAIQWSVNGVVQKTDNVEDNAAITFPSSITGIPTGFVLQGWVASEINVPQNSAPTYVTSATSTFDITYYAVLAIETPGTATWTLDYEEDNESGKSVKDDITLGYGSAVEYTAADGSTWTIKAYKNNGMQINAKKDASIKVPSCSGKITSIALTLYSGATNKVGFSEDDYEGGSIDNVDYLAVASSAGTSQTLDLSEENATTGYVVPNGGNAQITKIVVTYSKPIISKYCTTINTFTNNDGNNWNTDENWSWGAVPTTEPAVTISAACTIPSGITANVDNIIIADGGSLTIANNGQLICNNAVSAKVQKSITGYGEGNDKWYFIASPINVNNLAPTSVENMTENSYDLYQLNNTAWENYKEHEGNAHPLFNLENGRGYLYANSNDVTLEFAGTVKPYDANHTIPVTEGWNLVGNPYTFDAYANVAYYAMNAEGTGITANTVATSTAVKPCTGIVIYAGENGTVKFLDEEPEEAFANNGNLQMVLSQQVVSRGGASTSSTIDNAIVSFNEGTQLKKFYFGEPKANIFIPQNDEDYAIVFSNRQGDMPLNFKANELGTYTISFAGEEMDLNGIYLIDMFEQKEIDLSVNPSYTFIGSPADRTSRFKIVFRTTGFENAPSDIFAYQNGNEIVVSGEGELQIFDVMGRRVSTQQISGVETINVSAQGVYIFRLIGSEIKTQKIVVR